MGTAVLSPQDCLSSHLKRYNPPLVTDSYPSVSPPQSKRKAVQSSIMRSLVSECNRPDYSSANSAVNFGHTGSISNQASGLLPTPQSRTSTAHVPLPFNYPLVPHTRPRLMSSTVTPPCDINSELSALPVRSMRDGLSSTYHARSHIWPSRSSSTGPIVCFSHSNNKSLSMERPYASTGRHPFRLVQGNEMTNQSALNTDSNINVLQENVQYSKFSDTKSFRKGVSFDDKKRGVREKLNESDVVGDIRKRSQGDFLPTKFSKEGEDVYLKPTKKEMDGKKGGKRQLVDQVSTRQIASGAGFKQKIASGPAAVVTILQRPKSKKAARELLEKFEWKGQACVSPSAQTGRISRSCSDVGDSLQAIIPEGQYITSSASALAANFTSTEKEVDDSRRIQSALCEVFERRKVDSGASACKREGVFTEDATDSFFPLPPMMLDERWAGPAYSISPPPSSLPLPNFSLMQFRSCSLELHFMENMGTSDQTGAASTSIIPPGQGVIHHPGVSPHDGRIDVANATRDLRRILNLDSC